MIKTVSERIDDIDFKTTQLPAMQSFTLLTRLTKVAGPVFTALGTMQGQGDLLELVPLLSHALKDMNPEEMTALALEVLKGTSAVVQDPLRGTRQIDLLTPPSVDLVFSGRLLTMLKVMLHAIKTNYGDFLPGSDPSAPELTTPTPNAL